ncbi:hypothetical protein, partial [Microcella sp.]|uniref:hypothetical protein n=1 Tax=Microcella sp. TaxID=1913979 RepID=UPI003F6F7EAD
VVVTRRVAAVAAAVAEAHPEARIDRDPAGVPVGSLTGAATVPLEPRILIADPEAWQSAWTVFSHCRRAAPVVFFRADAADLRALLGVRTTPPPLDEGEGEVWVAEPGEPVRRRRWITLSAG